MPKKAWGTNEKVEAARDRKNASKATSAAAQKQSQEDEYWKQHDNPKGKKDVKKEEQARKAEEAAARKAELKRLAAEEEAAMANAGKKKTVQKVSAPKVTAHQLHIMKEEEKKQAEKDAEERYLAAKRMVSEEKYVSQIEVENFNREDTGVEARSLDQALKVLSVADGPTDRHPEKRAKAVFQAYYEQQLPILKEDKPGLKLMQYKSMIFENWQRSPDNPRNQKPAQ